MFSDIQDAQAAAALLLAFDKTATAEPEERENTLVVRFRGDGADGYFPTWERVAMFIRTFYAPQPVA